VLTPDVPTEEPTRTLDGLSDLQICFRLVRPAEFEALARKYMPRLRHQGGVVVLVWYCDWEIRFCRETLAYGFVKISLTRSRGVAEEDKVKT